MNIENASLAERLLAVEWLLELLIARQYVADPNLIADDRSMVRDWFKVTADTPEERATIAAAAEYAGHMLDMADSMLPAPPAAD